MKKDHIDEHEEWQRHQFEPGYFTGGRIPIWIKSPNNSKRLGAIFLTFGLLYGGWTIYYAFSTPDTTKLNEPITSYIYLSLIAIAFILAGIKLIRK